MNYKYVGRAEINEHIFSDRTITYASKIIKSQMADSFRRYVEDKVNPIELMDKYSCGYNTRIYEQTLYIFTKEELHDFIASRLKDF